MVYLKWTTTNPRRLPANTSIRIINNCVIQRIPASDRRPRSWRVDGLRAVHAWTCLACCSGTFSTCADYTLCSSTTRPRRFCATGLGRSAVAPRLLQRRPRRLPGGDTGTAAESGEIRARPETTRPCNSRPSGVTLVSCGATNRVQTVSLCTRPWLVRRRTTSPTCSRRSPTFHHALHARLQQWRPLPTKNWWACILCRRTSCMESPIDRTETHAVVDSNIQAPSEVFSLSHGVLTLHLRADRSSRTTNYAVTVTVPTVNFRRSSAVAQWPRDNPWCWKFC